MGSVPNRRCARGRACHQVRRFKLEEPPKLRATRQGDICEKCEEELAGGYKASSAERWKDEVAEAIQTVRPGKAVLWDLFVLNPHNGGRGKLSDFGEVLTRLGAHTLTKLRDWLDENRDQAVERYGYNTWLRLRTYVGLSVILPADMHLPDTKDGLPFQIVAMRKDGKQWDLNIPIRAELLRMMRRHFSERDYAKLLVVGRHFYRNMRRRMRQEAFTLDKFTADILWRIVYGGDRGRKRRP